MCAYMREMLAKITHFLYNKNINMTESTLAIKESIDRTIGALKERGTQATFVANRAEALEKIKSLIPQGASVMNDSSRTLEEIGFVEYLTSGNHGWNNLHANILAEKDPAKQTLLRKQAVLSDFYLGSVHAVAETGEFVIASNSGSQLPHVVFTSSTLIFIVGVQKITPTLELAIKRTREYVAPLEDARMKEMGYGGSTMSKLVIFEREQPFLKRNVRMIFVNEKLGF